MALTDKLGNIGDAIRAKTGGTAKLTLDEMPTAIASIEGSGGDSGSYGLTGGTTRMGWVRPSAWPNLDIIDIENSPNHIYITLNVRILRMYESVTFNRFMNINNGGYNYSNYSYGYITDEGYNAISDNFSTTEDAVNALVQDSNVGDVVVFHAEPSNDVGYGFYDIIALLPRAANTVNTNVILEVVANLPNMSKLTRGYGYTRLGSRQTKRIRIVLPTEAESVTINNSFNDLNLCEELDITNITALKWNGTSLTWGLFQNCYMVKTIDLSSVDTSEWESSNITSGIFGGCYFLEDLTLPTGFLKAANMSFNDCRRLTHDSLISILNALPETSTTYKLTLHSTNLAKLTDDEKAIATDKGWTLA